jgi:hypothetical protein
LGDAIEDGFSADTEDALIVWNNVRIPIDYKYDMSVIIDDVLDMLEQVMSARSGSHRVTFASDTFNSVWELEWEDDRLSISPIWLSVRGPTDVLTSACGRIESEKEHFLAEWKVPFKRIVTGLQTSGISLLDASEYERLARVEASIRRYGRLYREGDPTDGT